MTTTTMMMMKCVMCVCVKLQVVKDAVDQICDVLDVHDPDEKEEYTLYIITNSGALYYTNIVSSL